MYYLKDLFLIYVNLLGLILLFSLWKRIRVFCAPLAAISGIFVLIYPSTLFGVGRLGFRLIQIINGIAYIISFYLLFHPQHRKNCRSFKSILPMLITFTLGFGIIGILSKTHFLSRGDEYANYYPTANSLLVQGKKLHINIAHSEYPYAAGIFQAYCSFVSSFFNPSIWLLNS